MQRKKQPNREAVWATTIKAKEAQLTHITIICVLDMELHDFMFVF